MTSLLRAERQAKQGTIMKQAASQTFNVIHGVIIFNTCMYHKHFVAVSVTKYQL
jgi:hypothetical protein